MDIGRTNKRIAFYGSVEQENELGQIEQIQKELFRTWASVEPLRGREYQEAQKIRPELTYKITIRYRPGITPDMHLKYKERLFEIVSVINMKEQNEIIELMCTEKISKEA